MFVSIIVPIYNGEKYLNDCIKSIIEQNYTHYELILINDGSTDHSLDICEEWKQKDERIKVYNQKNSGVSAARNYGMKQCVGKYLLFVDCDDYLSKDYLFNMVNIIIENGMSVLPISLYHFVGGKGFFEIENKNYAELKKLSEGIVEIYDRNLLNVLFNKLYCKDVIERNNISFRENVSLGEDLLFNIDYLSSGFIQYVSILEDNIYYYRIGNPDSLSSKYNEYYFEYQKEQFDKLYKLMNSLNANHQTDNFKKNYNRFISGCPNYYWKNAPRQRLRLVNKVVKSKEYKEYILQRKGTMSVIAWHIYNSGNCLLILLIEKIYAIIHH